MAGDGAGEERGTSVSGVAEDDEERDGSRTVEESLFEDLEDLEGDFLALRSFLLCFP